MAGTCGDHSGIANRVEQLEDRTDKHDLKLDSIEKRTVAIYTSVILILLGVIVNIVISIVTKVPCS